MRIEPLQPEDQADLVRIARQSPFTRDASNPSFTGAEPYRKQWVIGARDETGRLIGFAAIRPQIETGRVRLYFVGVDESCRNSGVGSALIAFIGAAYAGSLMELDCHRDNTAAFRLYRRMGFEVEQEEAELARMTRRIPLVPNPDNWKPAGVTVSAIYNRLLSLIPEQDFVTIPFLLPATEVGVKSAWPEASLSWAVRPLDFTSDPTPAEVDRARTCLEDSRANVVVLDFNRFTLLNLRRPAWHADLIGLATCRWLILTDSAAKYLRLNFKAYGLTSASLDEYVGLVEAELPRRLVGYEAHNNASYLLLELES